MVYKGHTIEAIVLEPQEWSLDEDGNLHSELNRWGVDQDEISAYRAYNPYGELVIEDVSSLIEMKQEIDTL